MKDILLNNFLRISKIPRKSGNEEKIANFFIDVAKKNKLEYRRDKHNNVFIRKKGNIQSQSIALQAHLDMVCVKKNNSMHNFETDGIEVIINGDEVTAKDTTLGADQGVGLAMMLTIMEDNNLKHPDIEFILTTEEETTFNGADNFSYEIIKSKRLINLDNDKDDTVVIGSDGDILEEFSYVGVLESNNLPCYKVMLKNLPGGNSGNKPNESKNNAIITMVELLNTKNIYLHSINGGTYENDIATSCEVIISTNDDLSFLNTHEKITVEKTESNECFTKDDTKKIFAQIESLESGIINEYSSSANLGVIKTIDNKVTIDYIIRSSNQDKLNEFTNKIEKLKYGFNCKRIYQDNIWSINTNSILLKAYKELYRKIYNEYPKENICHGGTECSTIKNNLPNLDIISIGANMESIHTTDEVTYISSWHKVYNLLIKLFEIKY